VKCYVDSSVLLRYLLTDDREFERTREFEHPGSSELLGIECHRVLQRYRLEGAIGDQQLQEAASYLTDICAGLTIFELSPQVKRRATQAFPTTIGTLDALHLSTAILWAELDPEPLVLLSADGQLRTCAQAVGIHAI
jgi:predicted nucleic acid-binding protein